MLAHMYRAEGNDVDSVWPATPFTPSELSDIAFSSFPDSATQGVGLGSNSLTTFTWRIPRDRTRQVIETQTSYDFLYGHVSFSQQKSEAFRRNYLQRSLVLITHRPEMIGLFSTLMDMLGPLHTKPEAQASAIIEVVRIQHLWMLSYIDEVSIRPSQISPNGQIQHLALCSSSISSARYTKSIFLYQAQLNVTTVVNHPAYREQLFSLPALLSHFRCSFSTIYPSYGSYGNSLPLQSRY